MSVSSHWRKPPGSATMEPRISLIRGSQIAIGQVDLHTQKLEHILEHQAWIVVLDHDHDMSDVDHIEVAL